MKILKSIASENEELRCQVQNLEEENQRLRELYRNRWTHGRSGSLAQTSIDISITTETPIRSYQRPTVASRNRAAAEDSTVAPSRLSVRVEGGLQYEDGKLIGPRDVEDANFSKPTHASSRRRLGKSYRQQAQDDNEPPPTPEPHDGWPFDRAETPVEDTTRTCTKCDLLDKADEDTSDDSLEVRSRLQDHDFYRTPASTCFVPFRDQLRLLKGTHRFAQETLWCALHEHWPHRQRSWYLEGPEEVKFGRDELYPYFGNETLPLSNGEMCGSPSGLVVCAILGVVYLRNAICHPGHHSTEEVDGLMKYAQRLAVVLQDESRAFKIRKLRDELQAKAVESYKEIETYKELATLPFAKPWPVSIERFFGTVCLNLRCGRENGYDEMLKQAAREWQLKWCSPGKSDARYLANVEKAKSYVRFTEHGRRASISELPGIETRKPSAAESRAKQLIPKEETEDDFGGW